MNELLSPIDVRTSARDQFLGLVSHELRSPIAVILGFAARARRDPAISHDVADSLDEISRQAEILQRTIEDMLLLATTGDSMAVCEPVLLQRELPRLAADYERLVPAAHVTVAASEHLPPVLAEPGYLRQMITNLLTNATKYSGGSPEIWIVVSEGPAAGEVRIAVLDNGPGIPEDELSQVLQPFFRSATTAGLAGGVGLGLAVCKRMADAQHGEMWLKNRPGGGLEAGFSLRSVPVEVDESVPATSRRPAPLP